MLWPRSGRRRTSCRSPPPASGTWVRPNNPPGFWNDRRPFRQPARAEPALRRGRQDSAGRADSPRELGPPRERPCRTTGKRRRESWNRRLEKGGTEGSNPSPSTDESVVKPVAKPVFLAFDRDTPEGGWDSNVLP